MIAYSVSLIQCLEELVEDEFIEYCIEQMLEEEDKVYNYIQFYVDDNPDAEPDFILQHLHAYARNNNIELEFLQVIKVFAYS